MRLKFLTTFLLGMSAINAAIPYVSIGAGMFDISRAHPYAQFQLEYRSGYRFWQAGLPIVGCMATARGAAYFFAGLAADFVVGNCLTFMPSLAAGYYMRGGGKDLFCPLEFRTAIEGAYIFPNKMRLGLQFSHISNANLGSHNPGEESLVLSYSVPLQKF